MSGYSKKSVADLVAIITRKDEELKEKDVQYRELGKRLLVLEKQNDFEKRFVNVEKRIAQQEQYSRRECVEFDGFSQNINDEDIEQKVVEVLGEVGLNVTSRDFHAVHRLKNKKKSVIAKFVNRKDAVAALKKRKSIKDLPEEAKARLGVRQLYLNESLCAPFRKLFGVCNSLYKKKLISKNYTFNGTLYVVLKEGDDRKTIYHIRDLKDLLGDEVIDEILVEHANGTREN